MNAALNKAIANLIAPLSQPLTQSPTELMQHVETHIAAVRDAYHPLGQDVDLVQKWSQRLKAECSQVGEKWLDNHSGTIQQAQRVGTCLAFGAACAGALDALAAYFDDAAPRATLAQLPYKSTIDENYSELFNREAATGPQARPHTERPTSDDARELQSQPEYFISSMARPGLRHYEANHVLFTSTRQAYRYGTACAWNAAQAVCPLRPLPFGCDQWRCLTD